MKFKEYLNKNLTTAIKNKLIKKAEKRHGKNITPCSGHKEFDFTLDPSTNKFKLWYNDESDSSHIVKEIKEVKNEI